MKLLCGCQELEQAQEDEEQRILLQHFGEEIEHLLQLLQLEAKVHFQVSHSPLSLLLHSSPITVLLFFLYTNQDVPNSHSKTYFAYDQPH